MVKILGQALYSNDREAIRRRGFSRIERTDPVQLAQREEEKFKGLTAIGWEPLALDRILGPWDMIWTQKNGRVEIELLEEGIVSMRDGMIDVIGRDDRPTRKKRLYEDSFLIMIPELYLRAKVNKILGEVWVAKDREKVQMFFRRYSIPRQTGRQSYEEQVKWREMLKRQELE